MRDQSNHDPDVDVWAEHLIVLYVVGIEHGRARQQVYETLHDVDPGRLDSAIERLTRAGVVAIRGETVIQTAALDRLDRLDLICI
jgi:glutamate/tyrosine decarboxylase-like PLP-dependent enzyme